jgi:methylase of polypeptide subunit release factors
MFTEEKLQQRRALLKASQDEKFPYIVDLCGMSLEVDCGVFSPKWFQSSRLFCEMLPSVSGLRVLDMGCGCGVIAIYSALDGATVADGVDIMMEAVENTRRNAELLGVSDIVHCWQSDLFSEVPCQNQYDLIFWNPPWLYVNENYQFGSQLEMTLFDPGYKKIDRFLSDAISRLSHKGRILLGFADFGEIEKLSRLAFSYSYSMKKLAQRTGKAPEFYQYMLYEFRPEKQV